MPGKIDPQTGLPLEEAGIEETGFFDIVEPYKKKLLSKIPSSPAGDLTAKTLDVLVPDSPDMLLGRLGKGAESLRGIIQKGVRAPKEIKETNYLDKVFGRKSQDASAYGAMKTRKDVEESRQKALDFLAELGIKPKK